MRRLTALAAVAMLAVLLAVPSAEAKGSSFYGLNFSFRDMSGKDVRKLNKSGAKTVRWAFFWARLEHFSGRFNWEPSDNVVGDLASKGIRVLPILYGTPPWVAKSPSKPPIESQEARDAWKQFLTEAMAPVGAIGRASTRRIIRGSRRVRSRHGRSGMSPTSRATGAPGRRQATTGSC